MYVEVKHVINVPAKEAWELLADWGGAKKIFTICASCESEGSGLGASRVIRVLGDKIDEIDAGNSHELEGHAIRETCTRFEPDNYLLSYAVEEPSPLPVTNYVATVQIVAVDETNCEITWSSQSEPKTTEAEARGLFEASYLDGIEGIALCAKESTAD